MSTVNHDVDVAAITDIGLKRTANEDFYQVNRPHGFFLVADGMGGHSSGAVASRMAATIVSDILRDYFADKRLSISNSRLKEYDHYSRALDPDDLRDVIKNAVTAANNAIYMLNRKREYPDGTGMGTAFAGLCMMGDGRGCVVFHVGDCRVYLYRNGVFRQLTQDHTLYQMLKESGRQGGLPAKNILLRALGPWPHVDVEIHMHDVQVDDVFLICSDGLTEMLDNTQILKVIQEESCSLEQRCKKMVALANDAGGLDNITVTLVKSPTI